MTVHLGTNAVPGRVVRDGEYAQLRLARAGGRRARRPCRAAHATRPSAAASCSTRRRRAGSTAGGSRCSTSGTPEEIVRALVHEPVTGAELQARGLLSPARARPGARVGPARPASTTSRDAWLDELRESVRERLAARRAVEPARPRAAARASCCRTSRGRRRSAPARGRAPRREGLPARRDGSARRAGRRGATELEAQLAAGGDREGRRQAARGVPRGTRAGCDASATASRSRPRCTTAARELLPTLDAITLAGVSRRARRRPPHRAAPARTLRRRRPDAAARRRPHAAAPALGRGARRAVLQPL